MRVGLHATPVVIRPPARSKMVNIMRLIYTSEALRTVQGLHHRSFAIRFYGAGHFFHSRVQDLGYRFSIFPIHALESHSR